jgi:hypothetical protein
MFKRSLSFLSLVILSLNFVAFQNFVIRITFIHHFEHLCSKQIIIIVIPVRYKFLQLLKLVFAYSSAIQ